MSPKAVVALRILVVCVSGALAALAQQNVFPSLSEVFSHIATALPLWVVPFFAPKVEAPK
jgi:uncharacterized damage-inducible protein DinB